MLKQYVKNNQLRGKGKKVGKGLKIGLLLAVLEDDGRINIGHSKWNRKLDKYDTDLAHKVAQERIDTKSTVPPAVSITKPYLAFVKRAQTYYGTRRLAAHVKEAVASAKDNWKNFKAESSKVEDCRLSAD